MKKINSRTYLYIAAAGLLLMVGLTAYYLMAEVSKSDEVEYVYIDSDDSLDSVMLKVQRFSHTAGMTGLSTLLRHSDYGRHVRTGRYAIEPGERAFSVFRKLKNGQQASLHLTIPEARTMERLAALLDRKLMLDSATIAQALLNPDTCSRYGFDTCTIAALFVPDTYDVYWNMSLSTLLRRMQREHDRFWQGERTEKAARIGLTPVEVATLASIIDEETANNAEKPMIAGMYLNRLRTGMPLQADPTIKFALRQFELRRIYQKLLLTDSPYNTYLNPNLPPTPICSPSLQSIQAALEPADTDYFFFFINENVHQFSETSEEHQQAINESLSSGSE